MTEKEYFVPFECCGEDNFVEKRSKFTGRLWHEETPRKQSPKLRKCAKNIGMQRITAGRISCGRAILCSYSDDGEPQGTAGMPILEVLRHENLVDVCCVVTRYFGGILLGTGGLVRAYTKGAQIAVAAAGVQQMSMFSVLLIACPYNLLGVVQQVLPAHDCTVEDIDYGADVTLTVVQPNGHLEVLNQALADATAGTVCAEAMEEKFMGRRVK